MRDLESYRRKRHRGRTPEPFGEATSARLRAPGGPHVFVVQQHAARRLHWDLRLEIDGVLVSWAVPRGPSLDPSEKRLAVQTEDHPLEYADFEGVIPAGNYGAGAMIVWDRGTYRSADGAAPAEALARGKLDLLLAGHKLRGRFALVRTRRGQGREWLLFRKRPAAPEETTGAAIDVLAAEPASVLSGLTVEELRAGVSRDAAVVAAAERAGAVRKTLEAKPLRPMLARSRREAFGGRGWIYELKYDGVRVLAARRDGVVRLASRTGADRTHVYPEVANAMRRLPVSDFVLDGEIVALDEAGRSSFERLQRRFSQADPEAIARAVVEIPVVLYAFDLLGAGGFDLRSLPLLTRKEILATFVPRLGVVRFADHVEGDGEALFEAAREHGLEGIVAKRADSRYEVGRRSEHWLKIKVPRSASLVIVGALPGRGSRRALGSVMLAWLRDGRWVYAGAAGSGLDARTIAALLPALRARRRDAPAFEGAPAAPPGAFWVEPEIVCEVRFTEVTASGLLRHPVFLGLRDDVAPPSCLAPSAAGTRLEEPSGTAPAPADLALTRLDKVFWPVEGYTKGDLLAYYEAVWPWLAPYLRDRPVVLARYPDGIEGKHFYQKNAPEFTPDWALRREIDGTDYFLCNDLRTLLHVVNSGAIPLHVWSARVHALDRPDWLILDLDPKRAPFRHVVQVARHVHRLLLDLGAAHFVKTSGQDGLHVLLPLGGALAHAEARSLAEVLARTVCAELPEITTLTRTLGARGDKVYVDHLQNGRGKLIAAPLSVRPRPGAPVSTPLTWPQVTAKLDPLRWTIRTVPPLLRRRDDPLRGVLAAGVDVEALLGALSERLHRGSPSRDAG